jgi:oligoendopeptidase F
MPVTLPKRGELDTKYTWNLASIFKDLDAWDSRAKQVEDNLPRLESFKGHLADSPAKLLEWFRAYEDHLVSITQLYVYSTMWSDTDTANQEATALRDRARGLFARGAAAVSFAEPEILSIPKDKVEGFIKQEPALARYRHYLDTLYTREGHVRSPEVEQLLAMVSDPLETSRSAHAVLADAEIDYGTVDTGEGDPVQVAAGTEMALLRNPDIEVRRKAWEQYADGYLKYKNTFAALLSGGIKRDVFNARARNYGSALEAALAQSHIPVEVYENMLDTARRKLPVWHRYWSVKRRALGLDMLHAYDVFAPIAKEQPKLNYEESVDLICRGMQPLGDEYVQPMRKGLLEERWVDVMPNQGKRSGAYSSGTHGTNPFILMSFNGDIMSMSTLAHELGHSMHSYFSRRNQPPVYSRYGLFVPEVASNFNQALVRGYVFESNKDPQFQVAAIEEAMYNFHRYFFVMPTLARFELEIHRRIERGEALTADSMIELMAGLFREAYGPEVEVDEQRVGITWAQFSIHMYLNFYVYQYATGISAANYLASRILQGEPGAADSYKEFLKAGGSVFPLDALKIAGVDMTRPEPVERAFDVLESYIDRLEKLVL